jgi:hypothetical protein
MTQIGRAARSDEADPSALKQNSHELRGPLLACGDWKGARERSRRHDFASSERRTKRILRQRLGESAQRNSADVALVESRSAVFSSIREDPPCA